MSHSAPLVSHDRPKAQAATHSPISNDRYGQPAIIVTTIQTSASTIAIVQDQWNRCQNLGGKWGPFRGGRWPSRSPKKKLITARATRKPAEAPICTTFTDVSPNHSCSRVSPVVE